MFDDIVNNIIALFAEREELMDIGSDCYTAGDRDGADDIGAQIDNIDAQLNAFKRHFAAEFETAETAVMDDYYVHQRG